MSEINEQEEGMLTGQTAEQTEQTTTQTVNTPEMFTDPNLDYGMDFGVDLSGTTADTGTTVQTSPIVGTGSVTGDLGQVTVDQEKIEQDINDTVNLFDTTSGVLSSMGFTPMGTAFSPSIFDPSDRTPVQVGTKTVNGVKVPESVLALGATSQYIDTLNNLLSSEQADSFVSQMSELTGEEYTKQDFVESLGLTWGDDSFTVAGKYGGFSLYEYDEESNQYVKTLDKEASAIDAYLPVVSDALQQFFITGVATAGIGSFIGVDPATVKNTYDVVTAIENDDVVGAVLGSLELSGFGSPTDYVQNWIDTSLAETELGSFGNTVANWAFNNSDHLAEATVKIGTKVLEGEDLDKAIASGVWHYIKDGGGFSDLGFDVDLDLGWDFDFDLGDGWDTPEWLKAIDSEALQPVKDFFVEAYNDLNENVLRPVEEGILKPTEEIIKEGAEEVAETAEEIKDEYIDPMVDATREAGREIKETYETVEDWIKDNMPDIDVPDWLKDLLKQQLGLGGMGLGGAGGVAGGADEFELSNKIQVEEPDLIKGFDLEEFIQTGKQERQQFASLDNPFLK